MPARCSDVLVKARVLVLGVSSGIGFYVAEHALSLGAVVTISSSRQSKLNDSLERLKTSIPGSSASVDGQLCDLSDIEVLICYRFLD